MFAVMGSPDVHHLASDWSDEASESRKTSQSDEDTLKISGVTGR